MDSLRSELGHANAEVQASKAANSGMSSKETAQFEQMITQKQKLLDDATAKVEDMESQVKKLSKEKELIQKKIERVVAQKEQETSELKIRLEESTSAATTDLNERDRKINDLVEQLGNSEVRDKWRHIQ